MLRSCTRILAGAFVWPLALSAKTFTTLYTFSSPGGNVQLYGGLILGAGGELYGAASSNDITGEVYGFAAGVFRRRLDRGGAP